MKFYHGNHPLTTKCENYTTLSDSQKEYAFRLSDFGFFDAAQSPDNPYFIKYSTDLLEGRWASSKADCYDYYKHNTSALPLCAKGSAPIVTSRGTDSADYYKTTPGEYTFSYNMLTGQLTVGNDQLDIPCNRIILDLLSAGGYGGKGWDNTPGNLWAGGGGGSGAFVSLLVDLSFVSHFTIKVGSSTYIDAYENADYTQDSRRSSNGATTLTVHDGSTPAFVLTLSAGANGICEATQNNTYSSGGEGGTADARKSYNSYELTKGKHVYSSGLVLLDYKSGLKGGEGATCSDDESATGHRGGSYFQHVTGGIYTYNTISFGGLWTSNGPNTVGGTPDASPGGAGGGTGAASVYSNGRSYGDTSVGVGAGGMGSAAWEGDAGFNYCTDYTSGGSGGFFIYY